MTRFAVITVLTFFTIGCGSKEANNAPNKIDSATYVRPVEEKLGVTTMADFSASSGLGIYPGSETAAGEKFSHGDGVVKSVIIFTTADPLNKIAEFYKAEGMDVKNKTMPIGATKSGAQVMISISPDSSGKNIVKVTGLVAAAKGP